MKKADPLTAPVVRKAPGADGKDPRIANPILGRLLHCHNMTMAQLAEQLPNLADGYIFTPVLDYTGLKDAYDFTLSFSSAGQLSAYGLADHTPRITIEHCGGIRSQRRPFPSRRHGHQLGVKLIKEKRPSPVLVIDHIEEKPTDN